MRAMVIDRPGGSETLHLAEAETPRPGPGQVLVRLAYAGVNPADWKVREGWLSPFFDYRFPFVLGFDGAGLVAALGEGVGGLEIGDRVAAVSNQGTGAWGTYADYCIADADRVARLPASVDLAEAAALPTAGMTAWSAVFDVGEAGEGRTVLINGGAGGVGGYAIQLARMAGAKVAATSGAANLDYLRRLGADLAIDYRLGDVAAAVRAFAPEGVDLLVDAVGQGSLIEGWRLVRPGGVVAPIATLIPNEPQPDADRAAAQGVRIAPTMSTYDRQGAQLRGLVAAMGEGRLRAPDIEVLDLSQAGEAHARVQAGHVRGKIVLKIAEL
jgi:NADPH:quinone reductase